jgi:hypothetical protein
MGQCSPEIVHLHGGIAEGDVIARGLGGERPRGQGHQQGGDGGAKRGQVTDPEKGDLEW